MKKTDVFPSVSPFIHFISFKKQKLNFFHTGKGRRNTAFDFRQNVHKWRYFSTKRSSTLYTYSIEPEMKRESQEASSHQTRSFRKNFLVVLLFILLTGCQVIRSFQPTSRKADDLIVADLCRNQNSSAEVSNGKLHYAGTTWKSLFDISCDLCHHPGNHVGTFGAVDECRALVGQRTHHSVHKRCW